MGRFEARFGFKDNSKPPPLKVWTPQYNRSCSELLQAKCDQLQSQGVLVDPAELGIDVKHVSPIMIQQKGGQSTRTWLTVHSMRYGSYHVRMFLMRASDLPRVHPLHMSRFSSF